MLIQLLEIGERVAPQSLIGCFDVKIARQLLAYFLVVILHLNEQVDCARQAQIVQSAAWRMSVLFVANLNIGLALFHIGKLVRLPSAMDVLLGLVVSHVAASVLHELVVDVCLEVVLIRCQARL